MNLITNLQDKYANLEEVKLNTNLKQNTPQDLINYFNSGLKFIPLGKLNKEPILHNWTGLLNLTQGTLQRYINSCHNLGLRLDFQFPDGSFLVSIDIEDKCKELMLKHFTHLLNFNATLVPWTKTQSEAMHLYLKTDKQLQPQKIRSDKDTIVELRMGSGNQNVIGPAKYRDIKETGEYEDRDYITYGNLMDAPFVSSELIIKAFGELVEKGKEATPRTYKVSQNENNEVINFKQIGDYEADSILSAIEYLRTEKISYDEWIKCGFALINKFGKAAKPYFIQLSSNPNYKDSYNDVAEKFENLLNTTKDSFTIGTLFQIAFDYGFELDDYEEPVTADGSIRTLSELLRDQFDRDDLRDPNTLLGYPLTKFKGLAQNIDGVQPGFYFLGAETNVGKTAFLTNLCLDLMETNPELTILYFSLDDNLLYTVYRYLGIMTGLKINALQKRLTDPLEIELRNEKREELLKYLETGRLIIKDLETVTHISHIESEILKVNDKSKIVVFIDGLYNLQVNDSSGGIREENIERASVIKRLVDVYRIPLFTTGELRKKTKTEGKDKNPTLSDVMETGKFAYNANAVWLLFAKSDQLSMETSMLTLEYAKNKLSSYKGTQELQFVRATGTMKERAAVFSSEVEKQTSSQSEFSDGGSLE